MGRPARPFSMPAHCLNRSKKISMTAQRPRGNRAHDNPALVHRRPGTL
jgi:hypothetical protein